MTYSERKELEVCTYPGCKRSPCDDHCQCRFHRAKHRFRNRKWKATKRLNLSTATG